MARPTRNRIANYEKMSEELRQLVNDLRTERHYDEGPGREEERHNTAYRIEEVLARYGEMEMP